MHLKLKEAIIDAVRDGVLGQPLRSAISTLSSDFCHFDNFSKVHLHKLSLVVSLGNICALMVESAFACCISSGIL